MGRFTHAERTIEIIGTQSPPFTGDSPNKAVVVTDNGEFIISSTERERNVVARYSENAIGAEVWRGLIDLDGGTNNNGPYPHDSDGRIDITSIHIAVNAADSKGRVRIGVVRTIDGTSGDIDFLTALDFSEGGTSTFQNRDINYAPSQLKLGINQDGSPKHWITNNRQQNATAINTNTTLTAPSDFIPNVGDVVIKFERISGTYNAAVKVFYHSESEA